MPADNIVPENMLPADEEIDLTDEERALLASLEDESLTESQVENIETRGAVMVKPSNRSQYGGVPLGETADDVPEYVSFTSVTDEGQQTLMTVPFGGRNDAFLKAALAKHAATIRNAPTPDARDVAALAAFKEAADARKAAAASSTPTTYPAMTTAPPTPTPSPHTTHAVEPVVVGISLGAVGRLDVAFRDVIIEGQALVLVADPPAAGRPSWRPPQPADPPVALEFHIAGAGVPVHAFPMDLSYPYAGAVHYVLMIDRPAE